MVRTLRLDGGDDGDVIMIVVENVVVMVVTVMTLVVRGTRGFVRMRMFFLRCV